MQTCREREPGTLSSAFSFCGRVGGNKRRAGACPRGCVPSSHAGALMRHPSRMSYRGSHGEDQSAIRQRLPASRDPRKVEVDRCALRVVRQADRLHPGDGHRPRDRNQAPPPHELRGRRDRPRVARRRPARLQQHATGALDMQRASRQRLEQAVRAAKASAAAAVR